MIDELDRKILALLREDARRSYRQLAKLTESTVPTISSRVKRMENLGIIGGYTIVEVGKSVPSGGIGVECHHCHKVTAEPVISKLDGKSHPFCCGTCQSAYLAKYERLKEGI
jgi:endogenous inhibitor of DNA gyrase (YacG/DUF329 family)